VARPEKTEPLPVCIDADVLIAGLLSRTGASHAILVLGELGLLRGSPRTATVAAEADGMVLALDGKDFLRLVGAGGPLRGRLLRRRRRRAHEGSGEDDRQQQLEAELEESAA